MLDADLARFYGVGTRDLNKAVSRNLDRFPDDFAFMLTLEETRALMFQPGTSKPGRSGLRRRARRGQVEEVEVVPLAVGRVHLYAGARRPG